MFPGSNCRWTLPLDLWPNADGLSLGMLPYDWAVSSSAGRIDRSDPKHRSGRPIANIATSINPANSSLFQFSLFRSIVRVDFETLPSFSIDCRLCPPNEIWFCYTLLYHYLPQSLTYPQHTNTRTHTSTVDSIFTCIEIVLSQVFIQLRSRCLSAHEQAQTHPFSEHAQVVGHPFLLN